MATLSCAITGHNPQRFSFKYNEQAPLCQRIKAMLTEQIVALYQKGVRVFYVGCAVGVDTWAAEIIIGLKQKAEYRDMELYCAVAFPEQADTFTDGQKKRHAAILKHCDKKETINRHHSPVAYKRLNYFLIDNTQYLIAVFDQDKSDRSGLVQMVNYATKKETHIILIHPDTGEATEYMAK